MPSRHRDVRDVGAPYLIGPHHLQIAQQVGILPVRRIRNARPRTAPNRLMAHLPAQSLQVLAVEFQPVVTLKDRDQPTASKARIIQVDLVQKPLGFQILRTLRHRLILDGGSRHSQQFALASHAQFRVSFFHQLDASPYRPSCLDFFVRKSTSTASCPIFECSLARSASKSSASLFPWPVSKTRVAPSDISFFHSDTCTGWMSKSFAICCIVSIPFSASSATRALN
jgi:hypothetical protein